MNATRHIRKRLGLTQVQLSAAMGVPQTTISHTEKRDTDPPPDFARGLLKVARRRGLLIDWNHIYGGARLPLHIGALEAPAKPPEPAPSPPAPSPHMPGRPRRVVTFL